MDLDAQLPPSVAVVHDQLRHQPLHLRRPAGIAAVIEQADLAGSGTDRPLAVAVGAFHADPTGPDGLPPRQVWVDDVAIGEPLPSVAMLMAAVPLPQGLVLTGIAPLAGRYR
jgi:hypothetical protein